MPLSLDYLVVGGGGAGSNTPLSGDHGGSGGEVITGTIVPSLGTYTVTIGSGGNSLEEQGQSSNFSTITALGGVSGFSGGDSGWGYGSGGLYNSSGVAGNGVAGISSSISGTSQYYGGGGGGGTDTGTAGLGGNGGGGIGGTWLVNAGNGSHIGGGGGGSGGNADGPTLPGDGGNGIVILSYSTGSLTATGGTITTSGGNTIHTFTANDDFIVTSIGGGNFFVFF